MKARLLLPVLAALTLGSCATAPHPLQGQFAAITPEQVTGTALPAQPVRWGGRIIETTPGPQQTCFQLLGLPLNSYGRPQERSADVNQGRFVACRKGFYDPAVFQPGRDVTFIGRVDGSEQVKIGEYDYTLPRLAADVVYLWPEQSDTQLRPYPYPYGGPWGPRGPWGPYHRFGWYGWW